MIYEIHKDMETYCASDIFSEHLNKKHTFNSEVTQWLLWIHNMLDNNYLNAAPSGKLEFNKKEMLPMCLENGE